MSLTSAVARGVFLLIALVVPLLVAPAGAVARPGDAGSYLKSMKRTSGDLWTMTVHSAAMGQDIPLQVLRPSANRAGAPTLYLLNGAGGGEDKANWLRQTDALRFFGDKFVNVVIPQKGIGSYYTDWISRDPAIGRPMWQTFLTRELPPILDRALNTNGRRAIAGLSMSATSVLQLAISSPGLYRSVASYSGCARTSTPEGQAAVRGIVFSASQANADNMWGPVASPVWTHRDPYLNAEKLRGTTLYLSSGSGLAGRYDTVDSQAPGAPPLIDQVTVGGAIEAATRSCTVNLAEKLRALRIPATVHLPTTGTHSWGYWQDELHRSWPTVARGLRS
nr:alpha/beta hydrolase family protein [Gordonia soli]